MFMPDPPKSAYALGRRAQAAGTNRTLCSRTVQIRYCFASSDVRGELGVSTFFAFREPCRSESRADVAGGGLNMVDNLWRSAHFFNHAFYPARIGEFTVATYAHPATLAIRNISIFSNFCPAEPFSTRQPTICHAAFPAHRCFHKLRYPA